METEIITVKIMQVVVPPEIDTEDFELALEPFMLDDCGTLKRGIEMSPEGLTEAAEYADNENPTIFAFLSEVLELGSVADSYNFYKRREVKP